MSGDHSSGFLLQTVPHVLVSTAANLSGCPYHLRVVGFVISKLPTAGSRVIFCVRGPVWISATQNGLLSLIKECIRLQDPMIWIDWMLQGLLTPKLSLEPVSVPERPAVGVLSLDEIILAHGVQVEDTGTTQRSTYFLKFWDDLACWAMNIKVKALRRGSMLKVNKIWQLTLTQSYFLHGGVERRRERLVLYPVPSEDRRKRKAWMGTFRVSGPRDVVDSRRCPLGPASGAGCPQQDHSQFKNGHERPPPFTRRDAWPCLWYTKATKVVCKCLHP